jgi:hypothetical protein
LRRIDCGISLQVFSADAVLLRGSTMRIFKGVIIAIAFLGLSGPGFAADAKTDGAVTQDVHCGINDGKAKEYGTKQAAEADGATNIVRKTDKPCSSIEIQ